MKNYLKSANGKEIISVLDIIKDKGQENFRKIVKSEIMLQQKHLNSGNSETIFANFEHIFEKLSGIKQFWPILKIMIYKGLDFLAKANYSGVEIRMISGRVPLLRKDFTVISKEEQAELLVSLIKEWKQNNPNMG